MVYLIEFSWKIAAAKQSCRDQIVRLIKGVNKDWFDLPEVSEQWLVEGLITTDDCAAANGKPKSGKSTAIRNLIFSVVKGRPFLNRRICLPPNSGRVLYIHLDRKDRKHRVASELRHLGITREDASRIRLLTQKDLPAEDNSPKETLASRCKWLALEVSQFDPHLVVIDLLAHFVRSKKGINDYDTMIAAIAQIQDTLSDIKYQGALLVSTSSFRKFVRLTKPRVTHTVCEMKRVCGRGGTLRLKPLRLF